MSVYQSSIGMPVLMNTGWLMHGKSNSYSGFNDAAILDSSTSSLMKDGLNPGVFQRSFKLTRITDVLGHPEFTLSVRLPDR